MERPKNYLVEAILVTIFCCLPLGIVGIVFAAKVNSAYDSGNHEEALKASKDAAKWTKYGFFAGIIGVVLYIVLVMVLGVGGAMLGGDY